MKREPIYLCCTILIALILNGCGSLLPSTKQVKRSPGDNFDDVKTAFDKVTPYKTTKEELKALGFDPFATPNIKILTYLDVMNRFLPNPSIRKEDLDTGIQRCIEVKASCHALEIRPGIITSNRYGNVLLDLFNFRRKTKEAGWTFEGLLVLVNDVVVYKLWGGDPCIDSTIDKKNPLGPLQEGQNLILEQVR